MKSHARSLLTLAPLALLAVGGALLAGQQEAPKPETADDGIFRTEITRVNMLFTVTDKRGRFVTDLNRDDFTIFENKKPQAIQRIHGGNRSAPPPGDFD